MLPPKLIKIKSDDNELVFVEMILKGVNGVKLPDPLYIYEYTKSLTKKGNKLSLTEKQIIALQKLYNNE